MGRFRYPLQPAVERCAECERAARRSLAFAIDGVQRAQRALAALDVRIVASRVTLRSATSTVGSLLAVHGDDLAALQRSRLRFAQNELDARRRAEIARAELESATRRRSSLERLRAKAYDEHLRRAERADDHEYGEANVLRLRLG